MDSASDRSGQWKERKKLQEMNQWKEWWKLQAMDQETIEGAMDGARNECGSIWMCDEWC
jgi:hypothetical protein